MTATLTMNKPTFREFNKTVEPLPMPHISPIHYATKRQIGRGGKSIYVPLCGWGWCSTADFNMTTDIMKCTCKECIGILFKIACKYKEGEESK